jgi:hypothetical protein
VLVVDDFLSVSGATPPALIMFEMLWAAIMPKPSRAALPRVVCHHYHKHHHHRHHKHQHCSCTSTSTNTNTNTYTSTVTMAITMTGRVMPHCPLSRAWSPWRPQPQPQQQPQPQPHPHPHPHHTPDQFTKLVGHGYRLHCCPKLCGHLFRRLHMQGELRMPGEPSSAAPHEHEARGYHCDSGFNVFAWDPVRLSSLSPSVLSMH